eukprot:12574740-Alexandrium_andersonii.AAC.1
MMWGVPPNASMARVARRHIAAWWPATAAANSPRRDTACGKACAAPVHKRRTAAARKARCRAMAERR